MFDIACLNEQSRNNDGHEGSSDGVLSDYYSMGRTRGIVPKVHVDCSWNQSRNTWKYENVAPVVFWEFGALRILPGVERDCLLYTSDAADE